MKKTITTTLAAAAALTFSNCAPQNYTQRDAAIGAGAGALGGAILGNQIGDGDGNAATGALIGAGLGGTAGAVIGSNKDQQRRGYAPAPQPQYNRGY